MKYHLIAIAIILALVGSSSQVSLKKPLLKKSLEEFKGGVNGGNNCMVCTVIVSLTEQLALIYNQTVEKSLDQLCGFLPAGLFRQACIDGVNIFGPAIISGLYTKKNPDVICHLLKFCKTDPGLTECALFPKPKELAHLSLKLQVAKFESELKQKNIDYESMPRDTDLCKLPVFKQICDFFNKALKNHEPSEDVDGDGHSEYPALRGSSWKGKDCNDFAADIYPGRKPQSGDKVKDTNCNGIFGYAPNSSVTYEDLFCKNSSQRGVMVLGDSISAHFHLPEEWFDATTISAQAFENVAFIIENEADWPQLSASTGYMNTTWSVVTGDTRSIYLKMWERNRCNFRDYENVAVNGANSHNMLDYVKTLRRNPKTDQPQLVVYSLVGNDVCNPKKSTPAEEFRSNVITTLQYLDTKLAPGSHVILTGLANGSVLYDALHDQIYPLGRTKMDVTYKTFYEWLACLDINPCNGWMTLNQTVRDNTTNYAMMLSGIVKNVTESYSFKNFDTFYTDFPIQTVFDRWTAQGGEPWQLLEPVDGFHMNQIANALAADTFWDILSQAKPDWLGPVNPNNDLIAKIFGDQGGY